MNIQFIILTDKLIQNQLLRSRWQNLSAYVTMRFTAVRINFQHLCSKFNNFVNIFHVKVSSFNLSFGGFNLSLWQPIVNTFVHSLVTLLDLEFFIVLENPISDSNQIGEREKLIQNWYLVTVQGKEKPHLHQHSQTTFFES